MHDGAAAYAQGRENQIPESPRGSAYAIIGIDTVWTA